MIRETRFSPKVNLRLPGISGLGFFGVRVEGPGVDAKLVEILINTLWMELKIGSNFDKHVLDGTVVGCYCHWMKRFWIKLSLNETREDEKLSSFTRFVDCSKAPTGALPSLLLSPSPPSLLSPPTPTSQREPIHHQPHIVVVCGVVVWYDWMMGVDVAHPLERRWNASFCVVSRTQCSNRTDADDSRMLNKQLLHARQD